MVIRRRSRKPDEVRHVLRGCGHTLDEYSNEEVCVEELIVMCLVPVSPTSMARTLRRSLCTMILPHESVVSPGRLRSTVLRYKLWDIA